MNKLVRILGFLGVVLITFLFIEIALPYLKNRRLIAAGMQDSGH